MNNIHSTAGFPAVYFRKEPRVKPAENKHLEGLKDNLAAKLEEVKTHKQDVSKDHNTEKYDAIVEEHGKPGKDVQANKADEGEKINQSSHDTSQILVEPIKDAIEKVNAIMDPLSTAFIATPTFVSFAPTVIPGKDISTDAAKQAAKQLMTSTPISQNAIVLQEGKKPRVIKAFPNVIVL